MLMTGSSALAQLDLISAQRSLETGQSGYYTPATDFISTTELGEWSGEARVAWASTRQTSRIAADGISYESWSASSGGAGHHSYTINLLEVVFEVPGTVMWTLDYRWVAPPHVNQYAARLTRTGTTQNLFEDANWWSGGSPIASGYLEAGRYELMFRLVESDSNHISQDWLDFAVSVPTPGGIVVLVAAAIGSRRRR